jgi:hypothetical protein
MKQNSMIVRPDMQALVSELRTIWSQIELSFSVTVGNFLAPIPKYTF